MLQIIKGTDTVCLARRQCNQRASPRIFRSIVMLEADVQRPGKIVQRVRRVFRPSEFGDHTGAEVIGCGVGDAGFIETVPQDTHVEGRVVCDERPSDLLQ